MMLLPFLEPLRLIAILRGIRPGEIAEIGDVLVASHFRVLEVPLNSPQPFESIGLLSKRHGQACLVGAGTVLKVDDVSQVATAGGRLIVMPHADTRIIREAKRQGMVCVPGVATPTEAFAALDAGADGLKLFPAEQFSPAVVKAWRAVLPPATLLFPVGGMRPDNLAPWRDAGASGFGIGSQLYWPGADTAQVARAASSFAQACARQEGPRGPT